MSKVTSKLQVTIPKSVAERHRIRPGDEIRWASAGDGIRIVGRPGGNEWQRFISVGELEVFGTVLPTANAGPDQVAGSGDAVTLDGSHSSDPQGNPLAFTWTQTGGTLASGRRFSSAMAGTTRNNATNRQA